MAGRRQGLFGKSATEGGGDGVGAGQQIVTESTRPH